ncbi:MAG: MFS transporter [Verrucomicrobiales bacterium]|nr:MFS transporter [Verrucomicrobiales bacterium]MCP5525568.1 MFS transporter [Verrucomicrobiales bacterium]
MKDASSLAPIPPMSRAARLAVLIAAFAGLVFDGVELGLMPVASLSVSRDLLDTAYTPTIGGDWFARFTAALMLGAALGGIVLGSLGDRVGRTRALGISILFYSLFAGLGAFVRTQEQMLVLRFLVGLGVGGVWPNAVALVAECWPDKARPTVAGLMGVAINTGILLLSQVARLWPITPDSWRWIFKLAAAPALLGLLVLTFLPESPKWLASRAVGPISDGAEEGKRKAGGPLQELFRPPLLRLTVIGILIGSIPLVGAWAASKWMIPWADKVGGATQAGYKALTQGWWAFGAILGSFTGAQIASLLGRRRAYFLISAGATVLTISMFQLTAPLRPSFHPVVFAQGFVATLFFGWLPLYLPELFPTRVRAAGSGLSYNVGRFATAAGVLAAGLLFTAFNGSYPTVGALAALIYALGMVVIWWAPDTSRKQLQE